MKQWAEIRLTGQAQDPTPRNVGPDLWNTVTDAVFRDGAAQPVRSIYTAFSGNYSGGLYYLHDVAVGRRAVGAVDPEVIFFFTEGMDKWAPFSPRLLRRTYTGAASATITPTEWDAGYRFWNRPTGGIINGCVVWNYDGWLVDQSGNARGPFPAYYDCNAATMAATASILPGWPTSWPTAWTARSVRPHKDFLIAMFKRVWTDATTVTPYPDTVFWSDAAAGGIPSTWTASSTNMAGEAEIDAFGGALVDGYTLGDDFILFKERASYRMTYVGGTGVFAFRRLNSERGMRTQDAAAYCKGRLIVAGGDDVYALSPDGSTESLMTDTIRRVYANEVQRRDTYIRLPVCYSGLTNEILVGFSHGTYPIEEAYVYDIASGKWGHVDLTFDGAIDGFGNMRQLQSKGALVDKTYPGVTDWAWFINSGEVTNAARVWAEGGTGSRGTATLTKYALDLGDPVNYKLAHRIRLIVEAAAGEAFTVSVTGKDSPAGTTVSSASATWTAGTTRDIGLSVQGRFFDVTVTNAPQNLTPWKLSGFDIEFSPAGAW